MRCSINKWKRKERSEKCQNTIDICSYIHHEILTSSIKVPFKNPGIQEKPVACGVFTGVVLTTNLSYPLMLFQIVLPHSAAKGRLKPPPRPVVLHLWVATLPQGVAYQISSISDTYTTIHNSSKIS